MTAVCKLSVDPDDLQLRQALFGLLLDAHPGQWSVDELVREISGGRTDFANRDAVENSIGDLAGAGLAHQNGTYVFASRAAVSAAELLA